MEQLGEAKMAVDAQIHSLHRPKLRARHPLTLTEIYSAGSRGGIQLLWPPLSTKNTERFTASVAALFSQFSKRDAQLRQQKGQLR